jgi:hypothetical protein
MFQDAYRPRQGKTASLVTSLRTAMPIEMTDLHSQWLPRAPSRRLAHSAVLHSVVPEWKLWFIQLSGWPVFLATVAVVCVAAVSLSVLLTRLSTNRSILWNASLAVTAIATLALVVAGVFAWVTRW